MSVGEDIKPSVLGDLVYIRRPLPSPGLATIVVYPSLVPRPPRHHLQCKKRGVTAGGGGGGGLLRVLLFSYCKRQKLGVHGGL